jgi:hypothetical protein
LSREAAGGSLRLDRSPVSWERVSPGLPPGASLGGGIGCCWVIVFVRGHIGSAVLEAAGFDEGGECCEGPMGGGTALVGSTLMEGAVLVLIFGAHVACGRRALGWVGLGFDGVRRMLFRKGV